MLKEFKEFIMKGNVLDLAVGLVIGAAFGKIVTSFVSDILMPPIGLLLGKMDFSNMYISLSGPHFETLAATKAAGGVTLNYGLFLNALLDLVIVGFAVFLLVRQVNRFRRQPQEAAPTTKECAFCISAIPIKATRCPHCTSDLSALNTA